MNQWENFFKYSHVAVEIKVFIKAIRVEWASVKSVRSP